MILEMWNLLTTRWDFFSALLVEHIGISLMAIVIAIIIGGLAGIVISEYTKLAKPSLAIINFLYTIPSISLLGFLIPFSGIGNTTAVIALTIYALLPMVRNTHTGITNLNPAILEAAKGMGSTRLQILYKIKLPLAIPVILSGIRSMVTMTIALAGIASFIGAGRLGVAIYRGITTNNAAMTMVGSLLIALLALVVDSLFSLWEHRMRMRNAKAKRTNRIILVTAVSISLVCLLMSLFPFGRTATIHVATKPMTEQYILGEMLDIMIEEETDLNVEITEGVGGGTSNIHPAMETGEFDIYPEYTGTAWNMVLKKESIYGEDQFRQLEESYKNNYQMEWAGMYGFNNTYGIVVRREIAEQYDIKTYSDLSKVSNQLIFGAEYDFFEREDGFEALCNTYGLSFQKTVDLDIGLKYQALSQKQIDVMVVFTTDGQLSMADAVVLEDDKQFFPSYRCGNVVRTAVLDVYPELRTILEKLTDTITDRDMAKMNYAVESEGKDPRTIAEQFLQEHNLLQ